MNSIEIKTLCKYVGEKCKLNVKKAVGVDDKELTQNVENLRELIKAILEKNNLKYGDDLDGFILSFTTRLFDQRYQKGRIIMEREIIFALQDLKEAFSKLTFIWLEDNKELLNNSESIKLYPFHKSFHELYFDVCSWVDETEKELKGRINKS